MKEQYSVNEILSAINELQSLNNKKKSPLFNKGKLGEKKSIDIPQDTLKLIEEAEATIKLKLQSE